MKTRCEILYDYLFMFAVAHEPRRVGESWCPIKLKQLRRMQREYEACDG